MKKGRKISDPIPDLILEGGCAAGLELATFGLWKRSKSTPRPVFFALAHPITPHF